MTIPLIPENLENLPKLRELLDAFRTAVLTGQEVGASGYSGYSGAIGPQGISGYSGTGGGGGAEAATFVVHPTPGTGDYTTIQAALNALPAEGGYILVRESEYALTTTITLPVDKPVIIAGCGSGTILDLDQNNIAAFTIPTGWTANSFVIIKNMRVEAYDSGVVQPDTRFVEYSEANGLVELFIEHVYATGMKHFVRVTDGSYDGATPGQDDVKIHLTRCRIRPVIYDNSQIVCNTDGGFNNIRTWMKDVLFQGDNIFAIPAGGRTEPLYGLITDDNYYGDVYLDGCELSLGGAEMDFGVIQGINSWLVNNDGGTDWLQIYTYGSNAGHHGTKFKDCTLQRLNFGCNEQNVVFSGCQLDGCAFITYEPMTFQNNHFTWTGGGAYPDDGSGNPFIIENFGTGTLIMGNLWASFDAVPTGIVGGTQATLIEIFAETTVIGNDFTDVDPPAVIGIIEVFNSNCVFIGNRFPFAPTSGPPMYDWNGSNYYFANSQLWWRSTGSIIQPAGDGMTPGKGSGNVVEGIRSWNGNGSVGGTATNSIVVDYRNPMGLVMTKGYLKNSGANSITVREQYITYDQGTFTRSTAVAAGNTIDLDPFDFTGLGAINYQVVRYTVDVSGTTIGWQTHFAAPGGVYQY